VLHFLYHYCGWDVASYARIGNCEVKYGGDLLATFEWSRKFGEADVPEFTFDTTHRAFVESWCTAQATKRDLAIRDALPTGPPFDGPEVSRAVLIAIDPEMHRRMLRWSVCIAAAEPYYFLWCSRISPDHAVDTLWCRAGKYFFYWNRDCKAWLRGPEDT
jgi:hypothetical protein